MSLVIALALVAVLAIVMLIFVGYERGPMPADVAVGYELAWQRRDYSTMFDLSAKELRDGMTRDEFIAAKRASDAKVDDARRCLEPMHEVIVDEVVAATDSALVVTRLARPSGASGGERGQPDLCHRLLCERRSGRWQVVAYNLLPGS